MAPKRKADPKQPSLEETVAKPVTKVKTKGTKKETEQVGNHDDLVRAKLARKHGNGNIHLSIGQGLAGLWTHTHIYIYICILNSQDCLTAADPAFQKKEEKAPATKAETSEPEGDERPSFVDINRAPVLTLWVRLELRIVLSQSIKAG